IGGMLLGWIAGTMAVTDPAVLSHVPTTPAAKAGMLPEVVDGLRYAAGVAGAALVWAIGTVVKMRRKAAARPAH
ncbi:MAG: TerC family protein, partial [Alphaproteobacteria bacterium]|nr:TerC family protein [Alphaproteobacteria bacterium]